MRDRPGIPPRQATRLQVGRLEKGHPPEAFGNAVFGANWKCKGPDPNAPAAQSHKKGESSEMNNSVAAADLNLSKRRVAVRRQLFFPFGREFQGCAAPSPKVRLSYHAN